MIEPDFSVPIGRPIDQIEGFGVNDILGVGVHGFRRFFVTVYSVATPPEHWASSLVFPTDILVLHHSPGWLARYRKNWRLWHTGEHEYTELDADGDPWMARSWTRRRDNFGGLDMSLSCTYIHASAPLDGLRRGDVLAIEGRTVKLGNVGEDGQIYALDNPGVFGTNDCPWLLIDRLDVFRREEWPLDNGVAGFLEQRAPHLLLPPPQRMVRAADVIRPRVR